MYNKVNDIGGFSMTSKPNRFLIGLIFIIMGVYFLADNVFDFKIMDTTLLIAGGACLLLYWTKKQTWSLIVGIILCALGLFKAGIFSGVTIFLAIIFLIPGIIFMVRYFVSRSSALLVMGPIFTFFGLFILLLDIAVFDGYGMVTFFVCMALAFLIIYILGKNEMGKWPLFPTGIFLIFALAVYIGKSPISLFFDVIPSVVPILFIVLGVFIIAKAIFKKN